MATCPLCSERSGKRYCPAKDVQICAVCCGTKREIEIDCPSSCAHLKASRNYEADKPIIDSQLAEKFHKYDERFVDRYQQLLTAVHDVVVRERSASPWLVDNDVIEVYKALTATMKTLSSGIYYESIPQSPIQLSLFRSLKEVFDTLIAPDPSSEHRPLRVSETVDALEFMTFAAQLHTTVRPKSRKYLDWICERFGYPQPQHSGGLILP